MKEQVKVGTDNQGVSTDVSDSSLLAVNSYSGDLRVHVLDEVDHTITVSVLVVVPRDELDESRREGDSGLGVENRGMSVSKEVGRHDLILSVAENALPLIGVGGGLHGCLDLIVRSFLAKTDGQIHDRNVGSWDTERHACND